ncbi:MAG TPA: HD domain-containing phosphohydrolase [Actinomycetota bacterium]|nr:HD domain-containing phosphohydrolase [Actinomycetota bacterium]
MTSDSVRPGPLLVVDDEEPARRLLARVLTDNGYACKTAGTVAEALEQLKAGSFDLVITDFDMPGGSGLDLLRHVQTRLPDTGTIMLTGMGSRELGESAVREGVYGYLRKPLDVEEMLVCVFNALARRRLTIENRDHRTRLEDLVEARTAELWQSTLQLEQSGEELRASRRETIHRLVLASELHDDETGSHVRRMSLYCRLLAAAEAGDDVFAEDVELASMMHDVGKIGIPDRILRKTGKLTADEYEEMKGHAVIGHRLLTDSSSELLRLGATIALTHHEWFDGSGYPNGLAGDAIPLEGRIAAIADVFDALTSHRVYRRAFSLPKAVEIMTAERGRHFDPRLLDSFFALLPDAIEIKEATDRAA